MSSLNGLILGLGLFFLGLRLVGENLRQLTGQGFRDVVKSATHTPVLAALLGIAAGALMQSATAVTFILVSMVAGGLLKEQSARLTVVWCNVGLTALAFLATIDIHPAVAYLVGGAGIFMGAVRRKPWNPIAGVLLGVGLLLFALGQMGASAAPLKDEAWFREGVAVALGSPLTGFLCGIAAAALLQSNTGAAMLVITLASAGAIPVEKAIPVIYGTNLGAIVLRLFLSVGLTGASLRLVRLEDAFCLFSGLVMMVLFYLEQAGIPLVGALASLAPEVGTRLAIVFLLSNLLPAIAISPLLPLLEARLRSIWPDSERAVSDLTGQALRDPATAIDLVPKALAGLLACAVLPPRDPATDSEEAHASSEFTLKAAEIERFCAELAAGGALSSAQATRLQRWRAGLHTVRQIGEAMAEFHRARAVLHDPSVAEPLKDFLESRIQILAEAARKREPGEVEKVVVATKRHGLESEAARETASQRTEPLESGEKLAFSAVEDAFEICLWLVHRFAKLTKAATAT